MTMSKLLGNVILGGKRDLAGCPDSKTKVVNIFRHIPNANGIKSYQKIITLYIKNRENR